MAAEMSWRDERRSVEHKVAGLAVLQRTQGRSLSRLNGIGRELFFVSVGNTRQVSQGHGTKRKAQLHGFGGCTNSGNNDNSLLSLPHKQLPPVSYEAESGPAGAMLSVTI